MALERSFLVASLIVGLAQVVDAFALRRTSGIVSRGPLFYFAIFEYVWAAFCVYILNTLPVSPSYFLALLFVLYIPVALAIGFLVAPRLLTAPAKPVKIPMASVYFGGFFGVIYASAAAVCLATA